MDPTSLKQIGNYSVQRFIDAGAFAWVFEVADPKFEGRRLARTGRSCTIDTTADYQ